MRSFPSIGVLAIGRMVAGNTVQPLGTAFAVAENKFATTAHITTTDEQGLVIVIPKTASFEDYQDTTDKRVELVNVHIDAYDPLNDLAVVTGDFRCTAIYELASTDITPPGTMVTTLGFPHADAGRLVLTQHMSAIGARVIIGAEGVKSKHIVLNTQARPGQSGSPVFNTMPGRAIRGAPPTVCAMVIGSYVPYGSGRGATVNGIDPNTIHQTTHAISAEYIKAML